jgi:predicted NodU family carbamoyl transferase
MKKAKELTNADCLVYMGGCAMNSKANKTVVEPMWKHIWSLPNPGDPSSSIGAVLYHTRQREWNYQWDPVKHIEIKV